MPDKKKNYAVYVREAGSPDGVGALLNAQVEDCMELALSLGYSENGAIVLREIGSGTTLDRPVLNKLRDVTAAGKLEAVILKSPDRLSRDALGLAALVDEFNRHGVEVHFVKGPSGLMSQDGLRRSVLADLARRQRAMIGERTRKGQMAAARDGRMPVGASNQPFGYDYDPVSKKRVVNEQEAVVVQKIFHQFADGASVLNIARMLNEEGVPTKRPGLWNAAAIRRVLTNSCYIGTDYYGKRRTVYDERGVGKRVAAPRDEWVAIRGYSPALVSKALFDAVNQRLGGLKS